MKCKILCCFFVLVAFIGCGEEGKKVRKRVGTAIIADGVVMNSYSTSEPNFMPGEFNVSVESLPERNNARIFSYIWAEDYKVGLRPVMKKLESTPVVIYESVSKEDAVRIVKNLVHLGCKAKFEESQ